MLAGPLRLVNAHPCHMGGAEPMAVRNPRRWVPGLSYLIAFVLLALAAYLADPGVETRTANTLQCVLQNGRMLPLR